MFHYTVVAFFPYSLMNSTPQQETKLWFGVAMVLVGFVVGFALAKVVDTPLPSGAKVPTAQNSSPAAQPPAPTTAFADVLPISKDDHIRGSATADVTILEYSDLECPFCARVHPTIKQLLSDYDGKVNWVFRHFPLGFHANAQKAAEAVECAAELGGNDKSWAMIDMIYEKGSDNTQLATYAKDIGLNASAFTKCLDSGKYATKTAEMMQSGSKAGVSGTPGNLIVNWKTKKVQMVSGAQPITNFKTAIDAMLK